MIEQENRSGERDRREKGEIAPEFFTLLSFAETRLKSWISNPENHNGNNNQKNLEETHAAILSAIRQAAGYFATREKAEQVRHNQTLYRMLAANLPNGAAFLLDHDLRYLLAEGQALAESGFTPDDFEGKTIWEALEPELAKNYAPHYRRALGGAEFHLEHSSHGRNYITHGVPVRDDRGQVVAALAVSYDITERKQAENEQARLLDLVQQEREKLNSVLRSIDDEVWVCDRDGNVRQVNPAIGSTLGLDPEGSLSRPLKQAVLDRVEIYRPDGTRRPEEETPLFRSLKGETVRGTEIVRHVKTGELLWREFRSAPILGREGEITGAVAVVRDITEIKRIEKELRENETRFRRLADAMPQLVWTARTDGRVDYYNRRYTEYDGIAQVKDGDWEWAPVLHPEDQDATVEAWKHAVETGEIYQIEHRVQMAGGSYRWHLSRAVPLINEHGEVIRWFGTATDIHDQKSVETMLKTMNRELEARVQERTAEAVEVQRRLIDALEGERSQLARDIHDGPMQDLYALLYRIVAIDPETSPEEMKAELQKLRLEVTQINQSLRGITQDLLPPTLPKMGLEKTIRAHMEKIQEANPAFAIHFEFKEAGIGFEDQVRLVLYRIYQNSITNVLRHAQAQNVWVRFFPEGEQFCLEIEDDGIGFELPENWIEFARQKHMGLVSSRERAEAVGGELEVQSALGKGTRLRVVIPGK